MKLASSKLEAPIAFLSVVMLFIAPFIMYIFRAEIKHLSMFQRTFVSLLPQWIMLLSVILIYLSANKKGLSNVFNLSWNKSYNLKAIMKDGFTGIALILGTSLLLRVTYYILKREVPPTANEYYIFQNMPFSSLLVISLSAIFIAPIVEELIMRKCIFDAIYRFLSKLSDPIPMVFSIVKPTITTTFILSTVLTSTLFSLQHFEWIKFAPIFVLGCYLQFLRAKYNNVTPCICAHMVNNTVTILFLILYTNFL